jgi:hypothetical protein
LKDCSVSWGDNIPDYFTNALQAHDVTNLKIEVSKEKQLIPIVIKRLLSLKTKILIEYRDEET